MSLGLRDVNQERVRIYKRVNGKTFFIHENENRTYKKVEDSKAEEPCHSQTLGSTVSLEDIEKLDKIP